MSHFLLHLIKTALKKKFNLPELCEFGGKCVADEAEPQITAREVLRSVVGIDLTYPPFLCLICSYLPCQSTLHTAQFLKNDFGPGRAIYTI